MQPKPLARPLPDGRLREALQAVLRLRAQRAWPEADHALAAALSQAAGDAAGLAAVGDLAVRLEAYRLAGDAYGQALAVRPDQSVYWFNRAAVRRFLGDLAGAEADYDACIALSPGDGQAWLNRSDLRVQTPAHNHVAGLERQLASLGQSWEAVVALRYALAKELEDLGRHDAAWVQLAAGARLRRAHLDYRIETDLATVDWLIEAFPQAGAAPVGGGPPAEPIFILGMPRTGSTLVDRMVSSHSTVTPAGELLDFGNALVEAARQRLTLPGAIGQVSGATGAAAGAARPPPDRRALVLASAGVDFAAVGADYLQRTRPRTGQTARFTDKLPLNYLYCGAIARALPAARMVHVSRHPLATCYGVFKVLFAQGYPFSYDLAEIGAYYIAYRRLMAHWQATLGERLIEVRYEDLVARPEAECRQLLARLDLSWEQACLAFERNPKPTATASASQVRRPLYTTALTLWQQYAVQLAPLRQQLEAAGIDCS